MSKRDFTQFPEPIFTIKKMSNGDTRLRGISFTDEADNPAKREAVVRETVYIPDGVTTVSFAAHPRITSIAVPHTVHTISQEAFTVFCDHYTADGYYPLEDDPKRNGHHLNLRTVILSEGLKTIEAWAFMEMEVITGLKLPKGLEYIGHEAFLGCKGLTEIIIPASVRTIKTGAFDSCIGIKKVIFYDGIEEFPSNLFYNNVSLTELTLPKTLKRIGSFSFSFCEALPEVDLPESVEKLGECAFLGCKALTEFTFKRDLESDEDVFEKCENLTKFIIRSGVKHPELLPYNEYLQSIEVAKDHPDFVTVDGAVYTKDKKTLVRVPHGICGEFTVPRGVTTIGNRAFANCRGITAVNLPSTVESIGEDAFRGCTAIENITLGGKVRAVGDYAFAMCEKLNSLYVSQSVTKIGVGILLECGEVEITVSPGNPIYKTRNGVIVKK